MREEIGKTGKTDSKAISNSVKPVESSNENPNGKDKIKNTKNLSVNKSSGGSVGDGALHQVVCNFSPEKIISNNNSPKPVISKITQIMFYKTDRFPNKCKTRRVISFGKLKVWHTNVDEIFQTIHEY